MSYYSSKIQVKTSKFDNIVFENKKTKMKKQERHKIYTKNDFSCKFVNKKSPHSYQ